MARRPQPLREQWTHYVLQPRRFMRILLGIVIVLAILNPDVAVRALVALLSVFFGAVSPFMGELLMLLIIALGFYVMLRPLRSKKRKGS